MDAAENPRWTFEGIDEEGLSAIPQGVVAVRNQPRTTTSACEVVFALGDDGHPGRIREQAPGVRSAVMRRLGSSGEVAQRLDFSGVRMSPTLGGDNEWRITYLSCVDNPPQ